MSATSYPSLGDNVTRSLQKINEVLFGMTPSGPGPSLGDNIPRSLQKINQLLFQMMPANLQSQGAPAVAADNPNVSLQKINQILAVVFDNGLSWKP